MLRSVPFKLLPSSVYLRIFARAVQTRCFCRASYLLKLAAVQQIPLQTGVDYRNLDETHLSTIKDKDVQELSVKLDAEFELRDYQKDAIESITQALKRGVRKPAVVVATGGGKTVIFSSLLKKLEPTNAGNGTKVLILAHTQELIKQAVDKIRMINPDLRVGIEMRKLKAGPLDDVVVASVQTLRMAQRLQRFDPSEFKSIIIDECHHAPATSYVKILDHFRALEKESHLSVIGFTATFARFDEVSLGKIFDEIVFLRSLETMIEAGELVRPVIKSAVISDLKLSNLRRSRGDYDTGELYEQMVEVGVNEQVVLSYMQLVEKTGSKSTLVFCVNVEHCQELCSMFQSHGIEAQYVTGQTSKSERAALVEDFKMGRISVLCNVEVFTEGTDMPNIDSIILARPTLSKPLVAQSIGRGLRLHKNKTSCHIVDLVGNTVDGIDVAPTLSGDSLSPRKKLADEEEVEGEEEEEEEEEKEFDKELTARSRQLAVARLLNLHKKNILTLKEQKLLFAIPNNWFFDKELIRSVMLKNRYPWTPIVFDKVWGLQVQGATYFLLKKLETAGESPTFEITLREHGSDSAQVVCRNSNLLQALNELRESFPNDLDYAEKQNTFARKPSRKQVAALTQSLSGAIDRYIARNNLDVSHQELKSAVEEALQGEKLAMVTRLFFAFRYNGRTDYELIKGRRLMDKAMTIIKERN
ncbi:uncharacterized protein LODBEIA_P02790 [Lodderomyces beijingensis]|uniref:ATP-dependent helicase IRC3 n=1 Tax=Lodderomyces beijingensis TaxID=1775926 RepID=A0ABP0ZD02_9ASCO